MINVIKWQKYIGWLKKDNRLYQINYFTIHYGPSLSKGKLQLVLTNKLSTIIPTEKNGISAILASGSTTLSNGTWTKYSVVSDNPSEQKVTMGENKVTNKVLDKICASGTSVETTTRVDSRFMPTLLTTKRNMHACLKVSSWFGKDTVGKGDWGTRRYTGYHENQPLYV